MTMRSNRWLMAMTGLAATTAWAQQEPAGVLDEITVTATRRCRIGAGRALQHSGDLVPDAAM